MNLSIFKTFKIVRIGYYIVFSTLVILSFDSCDKNETLGNGLISDEWVNAKGVDTFNFSVKPYQQDSLLTAYAGLPGTFLLGKMNDPIFGKVEAEFYSQIRFIPTKERSFLSNKIDSIVMSIRYDTVEFYGNPLKHQKIEVFQLDEPLNQRTKYYSDFKAKLKPTRLGILDQFVPNRSDSVKVTQNNVTTAFYPQLRIPLDTAVFMDILRKMPDTAFTNVDSFIYLFPGIGLVASQDASMMALNPGNSDSRITIYYQINDTTQGQFVFNMGDFAVKAPHIKVDNSTAPAGSFISGQTTGDSLIFIQGMSGGDARLQISYDSNWANKFLNFAVLEFFVAELPGDNLSWFKPSGLLFLQDLSSGKEEDIRDYTIGRNLSRDLTNLSQYLSICGGNPVTVTENGVNIYRYRFNISAHFQKTIREKKGLDLLITPLYKTESAQRVVLYGNKHSKYPAKLRLVYSE